jgi:hypothetical protein
MNLQAWSCVLLFLGTLGGRPALSQTPLIISVEKLMTQSDMVETGVAGLSLGQRAALDRWLSSYTAAVIKIAQDQPSKAAVPSSMGGGSYLGSSSGHWVKSRSTNGTTISLEDGSLWEIASIARIDTMLWLPAEDVAVFKSDSPFGEYKYTLFNKDEGQKASARYLGKE